MIVNFCRCRFRDWWFDPAIAEFFKPGGRESVVAVSGIRKSGFAGSGLRNSSIAVCRVGNPSVVGEAFAGFAGVGLEVGIP